MEYVYGNINESSFDDVMGKNNPKLIEFRRQFINTKELPDSCKECKDPHRVFYKNSHIERTKHILNKFDSVEDLINNEKIYTYDVRFNNLCNLKCQYCNPQSSSRIAAEYYKRGQVKKVYLNIPDSNVQQILQRFEDSIDSVAEFYFAGGEPLIMKEHYDILDICLKHNQTDLLLNYNSNMTKLGFKNYSAVDYWKNFKNVVVHASIDAGWEQFEFIRDGGLWKNVEENLKALKSLPNLRLTTVPTVAFWNMISFPKVYRYLIENNLLTRQSNDFGGEIMMFEMLRPGVLPQHYKDYIRDLYNTEYRDYPELKVILRHLDHDLSHLLPQTKRHVEMMAKKKGCDFYNIFPEFKGIFDNV